MLALVQVSGGLTLSEPSCSGLPSGWLDPDRGISSAEEDKSWATTESGKVKFKERLGFQGTRAIIYGSRGKSDASNARPFYNGAQAASGVWS